MHWPGGNPGADIPLIGGRPSPLRRAIGHFRILTKIFLVESEGKPAARDILPLWLFAWAPLRVRAYCGIYTREWGGRPSHGALAQRTPAPDC